MEDPCAGRNVEIVEAESSSRPCPREAAEPCAASGGGERRLWLKEAEAKRKKRVARYNHYRVEGKLKASLKFGLRWLKRRCSRFVGLR
ncbi:hypothetical protein ACJRO7_033058 [Eucalyptus globulus]|uniref:Uncharacterized protein n=1 Tax=Eucalyptus globulus TaxID=34317 RepID=A0ABD3JP51_EUCGL